MRRVLLVSALVVSVSVSVSACGGGGETAELEPAPSASPSQEAAGSESSPLVTAQDVAAAFEEAGLPMTDARDTSQNCASPEVCTSRVTTEDVSIYGFGSVEDAEAYMETAGEGWHQDGPIVLSYVTSGTPEELQPQYEEELAAVLAE